MRDNTCPQRILTFIEALQKNKFPNATWLAKRCKCSLSTAQRTIEKARDEFLVPIKYNPSKKGYYLTEKNYNLPYNLPTAKDELIALLLAKDILTVTGIKDIQSKIDSLWTKLCQKQSYAYSELYRIAEHFSSDLTIVGKLAAMGLLDFITYAIKGENLAVTYRSPWRHKKDKVYKGRIEKVHYSDGFLYLLFNEVSGRTVTLNCAFIKKCKVLNTSLQFNKKYPNNTMQNWQSGFGVWAGEKIETVEITIKGSGAKYFKNQIWFEEQEDIIKNKELIRKFPSILSPELVRKLLTLGSYIKDIKPYKLKKMVMQELKSALNNLNKT